MINRQSIFGLKQYQWEQDDIKRIKVGFSDLTVNNRFVPQLRIQINSAGAGWRKKKTVGLFTGRDDDELDWLADTLNRELGRD